MDYITPGDVAPMYDINAFPPDEHQRADGSVPRARASNPYTDWSTDEVLMGHPPGVTSALVGLAYDAALEPDCWPTFLSAIRKAVGGIVPGIFLHRRYTDEPIFGCEPDGNPGWLRHFREHFIRLDQRRPLIQALPEGMAFRGQDLMSDRILVQTEFYNDFLYPQRFFHVAGAVVWKDERALAVLRVLRARGERMFSERERRIFRQLAPHVKRALLVREKIVEAEQVASASRQMLDWFPEGVFLLDREGRVIASNRAGEQIAREATVLSVSHGRLAVGNPSDGDLLVRTVADAVDRESPRAGFVRLPRESKPPLVLIVTPLRTGTLRTMESGVAAAILVSDPEKRPLPPTDAIRQLLGVTAAEADVLVAFAATLDRNAVADQRNVSAKTVDTQIKAVLRKTGLGSQTRLLDVVLRTLHWPTIHQGGE